MLHWCCMSGRIATIFVLFFMNDNWCLTGVVCLVGLRRFSYCCIWLLISAYLVLHVWSNYVNFCSVPYNWQLMIHWCCMSSRITTIFVLFPIIANLCFTDVVCLVGLRLFLYPFLWLIIYASLVLYDSSDYDYFCAVLYEW